MGFELVWDKKKNRMVKRRIKEVKQVDGEVGTEEPREVTDAMLAPYIPNSYFRVNDYNETILKRELPLPRQDRDVSVDVYIKFISDYLNRLKHGRKPDKSYLVSAPDGFGKKVFAYQAIKEAIAHRLTPTAIIPTHDLYILLDKKEYTEFYDKFKDVDFAIITTGAAATVTDLIALKTALEHCERHGIPMLVLSRFDPESFYRMDTLSSTYMGVRQAKRGDFGVLELKGFNRANMTLIRDEIRKTLDLQTTETARQETGQRTSFKRERR